LRFLRGSESDEDGGGGDAARQTLADHLASLILEVHRTRIDGYLTGENSVGFK
jgi:hypothetical protein